MPPALTSRVAVNNIPGGMFVHNIAESNSQAE